MVDGSGPLGCNIFNFRGFKFALVLVLNILANRANNMINIKYQSKLTFNVSTLKELSLRHANLEPK